MSNFKFQDYDFLNPDKDNPTMKLMREKFPQYEAYSDSELAEGVRKTLFSNMDKDHFYKETGLTQTYGQDIKEPTIDQKAGENTVDLLSSNALLQTPQAFAQKTMLKAKELEKAYAPKIDYTNTNTFEKSQKAQDKYKNLLQVNPKELLEDADTKPKIQADWAAKEALRDLTANPHDSNIIDQTQSSLLQHSRGAARGVAKGTRGLFEGLGLESIAEHIDIPRAFSQEEADSIVGFAKEDREKEDTINQGLFNQWQGILDGTNKNYFKFALGSLKQLPSTLADSSGEMAQLLAGTPGLATAVNARVSNFEDEYMKNNGKKPNPSWYLQTALSQTALLGAEQFGITKVLPKMFKNPKSLLLATGAGAVGEGVQEYGDGVSEEYLTQKEGEKSLKEVATNPQHSFGATQGAVAGGVIAGGVHTGGKAYQGLSKEGEAQAQTNQAEDDSKSSAIKFLNEHKALELNILSNKEGIIYRLNNITPQGQSNFSYHTIDSKGDIVSESPDPNTKTQDRFIGTKQEQSQIKNIITQAFHGNPQDTTMYFEKIKQIVQNSPTNKINQAQTQTNQVEEEIKQGYEELANEINPHEATTTPQEVQIQHEDTQDFIFSDDGKIVYENEVPISLKEWVREVAGINDNEVVANLELLMQKHPENFKTRGDVFRLIKEVKENPTHFFDGKSQKNTLLAKTLDDGKVGIVGIEKNNPDKNMLVHATKRRGKELKRLQKNQERHSGGSPLNPILVADATDSAPLNASSDIIPHSNENTNHQIQGDNFVMDENSQAPYQYKEQSFQAQEWINDLSGVLNDEWVTNLKSLAIKHPEMFKSEADVFRVIKEIKDNPTHFLKNNKEENALIAKALNDDKLGKLGIRKDDGRIVHATKVGMKDFNRLQKQNEPLAEATSSTLQSDKNIAEQSLVQNTHSTALEASSDIIPQGKENLNQPSLEEKFQTLSSHPRFEELLNMRKDVNAKDIQYSQKSVQPRTITHENYGEGYETDVTPAIYSLNYEADFTLTKQDVSNLNKGKLNQALLDKLTMDLERLDTDPTYQLPNKDELQALDDKMKAFHEEFLQEEALKNAPNKAIRVETISDDGKKSFVEIEGTEIDLPFNTKAIIAKTPKGYIVHEQSTGKNLNFIATTEQAAFTQAKKIFESIGEEKVKSTIEATPKINELTKEQTTQNRKSIQEDRGGAKTIRTSSITSKDSAFETSSDIMPQEIEKAKMNKSTSGVDVPQLSSTSKDALRRISAISKQKQATKATDTLVTNKKELVKYVDKYFEINGKNIKLSDYEVKSNKPRTYFAFTKPDLNELEFARFGEALKQKGLRLEKNGADKYAIIYAKQNDTSSAMEALEKSDFWGEDFTGKTKNAKDAVKYLLHKKTGHIKGAFTHPQLGKIDLAWGNEKAGLKHILEQRNKQWGERKALSFLSHLDKIVENGIVVKNETHPNRIELVNPKSSAIVELTYKNSQRQWLVSAYKKSANKKRMQELNSLGIYGESSKADKPIVTIAKDGTFSLSKSSQEIIPEKITKEEETLSKDDLKLQKDKAKSSPLAFKSATSTLSEDSQNVQHQDHSTATNAIIPQTPTISKENALQILSDNETLSNYSKELSPSWDLLGTKQQLKSIQELDRALNHITDKTYLEGVPTNFHIIKNFRLENEFGQYNGEGFKRFKYLNYLAPTLKKPLFIFKQKDKYIYFKPFKFTQNQKTKIVRYLAVTVKKDGGIELITSMPTKIGHVRKNVKNSDEIFKGAGYSDFHHTPISKEHRKRSEGIIPQKTTKEIKEDDYFLRAHGVNEKGVNHIPPYSSIGLPERSSDGYIKIANKKIKLPSVYKPMNADTIRVYLKDLIGNRLYEGRVQKGVAGVYKRKDSAIRLKNYSDVETMAHEMAHFLDFFYKNPTRNADGSFFRSVKMKNKEEIKALSYTTHPDKVISEGFAEFVRAYLTNYNALAQLAPKALKDFETKLSRDKTLQSKMHSLQVAMHQYYYQGHLEGLSSTQGGNLTLKAKWLMQKNKNFGTYFVQKFIDKLHSIKRIEIDINGDVNQNAQDSAYRALTMVDGASSILHTAIHIGVPTTKNKNGYTNKGLYEIFQPASKHGPKRMVLLANYLVAKRANELKEQKRENLIKDEQIKAGLELEKTYPEFKTIFKEYQEFNQGMLEWYVDMNYITNEQKEAFSKFNKSYVPFHRVMESVQGGGVSKNVIFKTLTGGTHSINNIFENITNSLATNIQEALIANGKSVLYKTLEQSGMGAAYATRIAPDSKLIQADLNQQLENITNTILYLGIEITQDGEIIGASSKPNSFLPNDPKEINDLKENIKQILLKNKHLLQFFTYGHKPTTKESYVDSVIIDGQKAYFEVIDPLLVDSITSFFMKDYGSIVNFAQQIKHIVSWNITNNPLFYMPNFVKDTKDASALSRNRFLPFITSINGAIKVLFNRPEYKAYMASGGGYGTRSRTWGNKPNPMAMLGAQNRLLDRAIRILAAPFEKSSSIFEDGTRVGDFMLAQKASKSNFQSAWEAREIATPFSMRGSHQGFATFLSLVPFAKASINGMYQTYRRLVEIGEGMRNTKGKVWEDKKARKNFHIFKTKLLYTGMMYMAVNLFAWSMFRDDERYKSLPKDQKIKNMHMWFGDFHFKLPRSHIVEAIFSALPVMIMDGLLNKNSKESLGEFYFWLKSLGGIDPTPGLVQPFYELAINEKYTTAPIVPYYMQNMDDPSDQYTLSTPLMWREFGKLTDTSPLVSQHLANGFLGLTMRSVEWVVEDFLWNKKLFGEKPFKQNMAEFLLYRFKGKEEPTRTKYSMKYYEVRKKLNSINNSYRKKIQDSEITGDFKELDKYEKENEVFLDLYKDTLKINKTLREIEDEIIEYTYDPSLSRKEKETKINALNAEKTAIFKEELEYMNEYLKEEGKDGL